MAETGDKKRSGFASLESIREATRPSTAASMKQRSHTLVRSIRQIQAALIKNKEYEHVMLGRFEHLPPTNNKSIKIFLSSTFSDLSTERNHLMREVYPRLKEYCRTKYGIEFQVVDMRWGVRQEAQYDHQGPQLCYEELRNCQAVSAGPSFLTILGQRYGSHPPPYSIPSTEFLEVLDTLESEESGESAEAVAVLKEWYEEDENCLPSEYVLRPIAENVHEMVESALKVAKEKWDAAEPLITRSLTRVAQKWRDTGRHPPEHCHKYFCSVTEQEIILGILDPTAASMSRRYAAAFLRSMVDVESHLQDERASRFVDVMKDSSSGRLVFHSQLQRLMRELCEVKLKQHLPQSRIFPYLECWNSVVETGEESEKYLQRFGEDFIRCCQNLVDESMEQRSEFASDDLYVETLQHSTLCVQYLQHFQGRQEILQRLKEYITGPSDEPLVVHGQSGSGKTSVLGKCASEARNWLPEEEREHAVVLLRFLGTSPGTSNVRQTLRYLCRQLACFSNEVDQERSRLIYSMKDITDFLREILVRVAFFRKVIIFLDSLDQLDGSDGCHHLIWLPTHLPENVKLVVSTLPDMFGLLDTLRSRMLNKGFLLEVLPLETELCTEILRAQLKAVNRQLTEPQWNILKVAFEQCPLPIYVTLMLHQAKTWRSFFPLTDGRLRVEHSVRGAILHLFKNLEKKHGKVLVRHALGYITASRNGLNEVELKDLLSLDNDVLRDVFQYHLPPQMRIPPFCWSRLRHDISNYLVEREADGVRVLYWYHRQFIEAARHLFLESDEDVKQKLHSQLADYFLGVWGGGKKKPFQYPNRVKEKLGLPDSEDRNRHVPEQPYVFEESAPYETTLNNGDIRVRVNLRRLNELPKHLVNSNRLEECFSEIVFNYNFLFNKLRGTSRHELLADINRVARKCTDDLNGESVKLVFNAIRIASESLNYNCHNLRVDLLGRLLPFAESHPLIGRLLQSCDTEGGRHSVLRPRYQILDSGSGDIHTTFDMALSLAVVLPNNLICSVSMTDKIIRLYDTSGNLVRCVESEYYLIAAAQQIATYIPPDCTVNVVVKPEKTKPSEDAENENGDESEEESNHLDCVRVNLSTGRTKKLFTMPTDLVTTLYSVEYSGREWVILKENKHTKFFNIGQRKVCLQFSHKSIWSLCKNEKVLSVLNSDNTDLATLTLYLLPEMSKCYVKDFPAVEVSELLICHCCYSNLEVVGVVKESSGADNSRYFLVRYMPKDNAEESEEGALEEFQRHPIPENFASKRKKQSQPVCSPSEDRVFLMNHNFSKENPTFGYIWNRVNELLTPLIAEWDDEKQFNNIDKLVNNQTSAMLPVYSADEELIIFNGGKILGLVFSTVTGEMTRYISHAAADGFVSGVTKNPNLLVLSCFVQSSFEENKMSIVCRIYNIDALKKKQIHSQTDHILEEEGEEAADMTWNFDDNALVPISGDPLSDLFYFSKASSHFLMDASDSRQQACLYPLKERSVDFIILHIQQTEPTELFCIHTNQSTEGYCGLSKVYYYANYQPEDNASSNTPWKVIEGTPLDVVGSRAVINSTLSGRQGPNVFSVVLSDRQLLLTMSWTLFSTINASQADRKQCNVVVSSVKDLQPLVSIPLRVTSIKQSTNFLTLQDTTEEVDKNEEVSSTQTKTENATDGKWQFDAKLHENLKKNKLRLIQILPRPRHKDQLVLVAHVQNELHLFMCAHREKSHLTSQNLFNPGIFLIIDYSELSETSNFTIHQKLCWSDIFGPVVLLEDGLHAVNYRLQVLNIETGRSVRYIRPPEQEVYLMGLMPVLDGGYICGALLPAMHLVTLGVLDYESSVPSDNYLSPMIRTLRVYRLNDGALVGDYLFPEETQALQSNSTHSCVFFLANNAPLTVVELDVSHLVPPNVPQILWSQPLLKNAMFEVAEKRPSDPIAYLATYLRMHRTQLGLVDQ